jgi:hypothetical protein
MWLGDLKTPNANFSNAYFMNFKLNTFDIETAQLAVSSDCNATANFRWLTREPGLNPFLNNSRERMRLDSTGQLYISSRSNATNLTLLSALDAQMPNDGTRTIAFGKQNTNLDQAEFVYKHVGNGSGNNLLGIGFKNVTNLYLKGDGKVGVGTGSPASTLDVVGDVAMTSLNMTGQLVITNTQPTITLRDTNHRTGYIHMNSDIMYFLSGANGAGIDSWTQVGGQWPMMLNTATNAATFGGAVSATGNGIFNNAGVGLLYAADWACFANSSKFSAGNYELNTNMMMETFVLTSCIFVDASFMHVKRHFTMGMSWKKPNVRGSRQAMIANFHLTPLKNWFKVRWRKSRQKSRLLVKISS